MVLCASCDFQRGDRISTPRVGEAVKPEISPSQPQPVQRRNFHMSTWALPGKLSIEKHR